MGQYKIGQEYEKEKYVPKKGSPKKMSVTLIESRKSGIESKVNFDESLVNSKLEN